MAWRIDEGHLRPTRRRHLVGADVLRDAAGFTRNHVGLANGVEQARLAVVDVAHDGDDGCTCTQIVVDILLADEAGFDVGFRNALRRMSEFRHEKLGRIRIDHVGDLVHGARLHQDLDEVHRPLGHAVREFLDGDRFWNNDFAHNLVPGLLNAHCLELLALALALQRCKRPLALLLVERIVDRKLAALAPILADLDGCANDLAAALAAGVVILLHIGHGRTNALLLGLDRLDNRAIGHDRCLRTREFDVLGAPTFTRRKARIEGLLRRDAGDSRPRLPPGHRHPNAETAHPTPTPN